MLSLTGVEPTFAFMACLMHRENPKVAPEAVSDDFFKSISFRVEPRWHVWVLLMILAITGNHPWSLTIAKLALGILVGTLKEIRWPSVWPSIKQLFYYKMKFILTLALYVMSTAVWPITAAEFDPVGLISDPSKFYTVNQFAYMQICIWREPVPEAFFLLRLSYVLIPISSLGAFDLELMPKIYCAICVLLLMSVMNTQSWGALDVGFIGLLYCIYGFAMC